MLIPDFVKLSEKIKTHFSKPKVLTPRIALGGFVPERYKTRASLIAVIATLTSCANPPEPPNEGHPGNQLMRYALTSDFELNIVKDRVMELIEAGVPDELTSSNLEEFLLPTLQENEVVFLNRVDGNPNLENAQGIFTAQTLNCNWEDIETLLSSNNQLAVNDNWENFERTYETDKSAYDSATDNLIFPPVPDTLPQDPLAEDITGNALDETLLMTNNVADPKPNFGVNIPPHGIRFAFRHGCSEGDEPEHFLVARNFNTEPALTNSGSGLAQNYSVGLYVDNHLGQTTRIAFTWSETLLNGNAFDAEIVTRQKINSSFEAGQRLEELCNE